MNAIQKAAAIICTNRNGAELYVGKVTKTRGRFAVSIHAMEFESFAAAEEAIATFRPAVDGTTFRVVTFGFGCAEK